MCLLFSDKIDPYLHILVPNFQSKLEEAEWEGRLVDIQRRMREELRDAKERGSSDFTQLRQEIRDLKQLILSIQPPSALPSTTPVPLHTLSLRPLCVRRTE